MPNTQFNMLHGCSGNGLSWCDAATEVVFLGSAGEALEKAEHSLLTVVLQGQLIETRWITTRKREA